MSATNRGAARVPFDYYETPPECIEAILGRVHVSGSVIEPGAGKGAIVRALHRRLTVTSITAIEIEPERAEAIQSSIAHVIVGDFLEPRPRAFDWAVGNPPFTHAMTFVRHALSISDQVLFLLRLNWLASAKRNAWLREHTPDVWVLSKRPSFTGRGTDATDYAWMHWPTKEPRTEGHVRIL